MTKKLSLLGIIVSLVLASSFALFNGFTDPFVISKHYGFIFLGMLAILFNISFVLSTRFKIEYSVDHIDLLLLLYYISGCINHHFLVETSISYSTGFLDLSVILILYFAFKPFFSSHHQLNRYNNFSQSFLSVLILIAGMQAVFGLLQYLDLFPKYQSTFALAGAYGNPGPYANFLVGLLGYVVCTTFISSKGKIKNLALVTLLVALPVLALAQTRTAWIAITIVFGYVLLHHPRTKNLWAKRFGRLRNKIILFSAAAILLSTGLVLISAYKKDSTLGRLFIYKISYQMIKDKPMFGHGFSSYAPTHNIYQADYFKKTPNDTINAFLANGSTYAFNEYLQIASETGFTGLILFLGIFLFVFYKKKFSAPESFDDYLVLSAEATIIALLVTALFSYPFQDPPTLFLLYISIAIVSINRGRRVYTFILHKNVRRLILIILLAVIVGLINLTVPRYKAEKNWRIAYHLVQENKINPPVQIYKEIYPVMKYNPFFLFNYGAELCHIGKFEESVSILREAEYRLNDSDFYIYLGASLEGLGKSEEAAKCFEKASFIMPIKFVPKYRLFLLYKELGNHALAKYFAQEIIKMPVKVKSELIDNIKLEMKSYLLNTGT